MLGRCNFKGNNAFYLKNNSTFNAHPFNHFPMEEITAASPPESKDMLRFHLYSLKFTPYKDDKKSSSTSILFDVLTFVSQELAKGQGYLIDKNKGRESEGRREIFMNRAVIMHKEKRVRCTLALLRAGRPPLIKPADTFTLVPLDLTSGSIAEQTHFFIDYSKGFGIICIEYNFYGPRISDVEYYLRNVARNKLKLSKITEVTLFMDSSIDKTIMGLKNVLNLDIKVRPQNLAKLDTALVGQYFTGITSLGQKVKPQFIKLEAMFQAPGKTAKSDVINKEANNMVLNFIQKFKVKPENIDCFENFVVKYEDKDGNEEVLNLLRGKKEFVKEVDLKTITKTRMYYELIEKDLDEFISSL